MSAQKQTRQQILTQLEAETRQVVASQYPNALAILPKKPLTTKLTNKLKLGHNSTEIALNVTLDEYQSILQKLIELIQKPPKDYQAEILLYLEQQLSDLLGFSISASQDEYHIPFIGGVMSALAHLKRTPSDQLNDHQTILEAGLNQKRSFYGWFNANQITDQIKTNEKYYFSLPIQITKAWKKDSRATAQWFKYRKLVMINPVREIAIVGSLADVGPFNFNRAQFGGSPEVIRFGQVWHPENKGKVAIFFVEDSKNEVPLGKIDLKELLQKAE